MNRVQVPQFIPLDTAGRPVASGYIYVGVPDTDPTVLANQKTLYIQQENGTITSVSQPIRTNAGGVPVYNGDPVTLLIDGDYSLRINNSSGSQVYYIPNVSYDDTFEPGNTYYPSSSATDQGVTGSNNTIKYFVDTIGPTKKATIYLRHDSGNAQTPYTFTTAETIPANIKIEYEPGAYIDGTAAFAGSPDSQIKALPAQQIFSSTSTITFGIGGTVYPEWFGAKGDGITNDIVVIQSAIDSVTASKGFIIFQPDKIYAIDDNINIKNGLGGLIGKGGWIKLLSSERGIRLLGIHSGETTVVDDFIIDGLKIDCNNKDVADGVIYSENPTNIKIVNNEIVNLYNTSNGINVWCWDNSNANDADAYNITIDNNKIIYSEDHLSTGMYLGISLSAYVTTDQGTSSAHWKYYFSAADAPYRVRDSFVTNNYVYGGVYALGLFSAQNIVVSNNIFERNSRNIALQNHASYNMISNNILKDAWSSPILISYGSEYNTVDSNNITSTRAQGQAGVTIYTGSNYNHVTNNTIIGQQEPVTLNTMHWMIYIGIKSQYNVVEGNFLKGYVDASYIALESAWNATGMVDPASLGYVYAGNTAINDSTDYGLIGNVISNNTIYKLETSVAAIALIQVSDASDDYILAYNVIKDNIVKGGGYQISASALATVPADYLVANQLHGNVFDVTLKWSTGFKLYGTAAKWLDTFSVMENNEPYGSSSCEQYEYVNNATPDVTGKSNIFTNDTAPTSITAFLSNRIGQVIRVRISTNTTIVHGASIKTSTGANITGTANNIYTFICLNDNVFYQVL